MISSTVLCLALLGAEPPAGLTAGDPELKSAGALAFAPDGVLLVADPQGGAIVALDTQDGEGVARPTFPNTANIDKKIAEQLGGSEVVINDMAVNPTSGKVYFSISQGRGPDAAPGIVRIGPGAPSPEVVALKGIAFAKAMLSDTPAKRQEAITDIAYLDGKVLLAGLASEEFESSFRTLPYPLAAGAKPTSVEIFHGAHGKYETRAPIRTFLTYAIEGKPHLVAGYTCTPLVKFPLDDLQPGAEVRGVTVAELGNRNRPLDMISYEKDGKPFLLIANDRRGVMKIAAEKLGEIDGITTRVSGTAGLTYETVDQLKGVEHLDKLSDSQAVILVRDDQKQLSLETIELP